MDETDLDRLNELKHDLDRLNELKHDRNHLAVRVANVACKLFTAKARLTSPVETLIETLNELKAKLEEAANDYIKVSNLLRDALDEPGPPGKATKERNCATCKYIQRIGNIPYCVKPIRDENGKTISWMISGYAKCMNIPECLSHIVCDGWVPKEVQA